MRPAAISPALVLLLAAGSAFAEGGSSVTIFTHSIHAVGSWEVIGERCGKDTPLRACSRFFGRRMEASCVEETGSWKLRARAQFGVRTWLGDFSVLQHEHLHIGDVRKDVEDLITMIEERAFPSSESCGSEAERLASIFPRLMDEMQRRSNDWRHPVVPRTVTARKRETDHSRATGYSSQRSSQ